MRPRTSFSSAPVSPLQGGVAKWATVTEAHADKVADAWSLGLCRAHPQRDEGVRLRRGSAESPAAKRHRRI